MYGDIKKCHTNKKKKCMTIFFRVEHRIIKRKRSKIMYYFFVEVRGAAACIYDTGREKRKSARELAAASEKSGCCGVRW